MISEAVTVGTLVTQALPPSPLARSRRLLACCDAMTARGTTAIVRMPGPDGTMMTSYLSDAPLRDSGAWRQRAEAVALRAALADALRDTVLSYSLHDVLRTNAAPPTVAVRFVAASDDVDRLTRRTEWFVTDAACLDYADSALLSHAFEVPGDGGEAAQRLTLRTLLAPNGRNRRGPWAVDFQAAVLGEKCAPSTR